MRRGPRQPQVLLPGDVVEGDSAAQTPEATDDNPCFPPGSTLSLGQADEEEEKEQEEARDGDALFLRQLERLWVSRREDESELAAAASPGPAAASPLPLPLPLPLPPPPSRAALGAPRPVFYDFLRATGSSPAPRWGHAAAALGTDALVVVGGVGAAVFEDVHVFDAIAGSWHEVRTTGPPMQQQRQQQQSQQQQQQRGLQRIPSNGSNRSGSCDSPASSSNLSPSSSSSSLNFAVREAPLTASSAASAALFARRDAGPGPHFGAAAAEWPAGSGRVFVFGGRQGRGFLRSAHELDVGRGAWRTLRADAVADPWGMAAEGGSLLAAAAAANAASSPSRGGDGGGRKKGGGGGGRSVGSGPPAVAGATLTAVGEHGLLLFGGAGKKVSGEVWLLRPRSVHSTAGEGSAGGSGSGQGGAGGGRRGGGDGASCSSSPSASAALSPLYPPYSSDTWIKLDISPDPTEGSPRPRHGHAAFPGPCGGTDSVVFFGGAASDGGALNDTWLLDLGTRSWRRPRHPAGSCSPPRARFSHCAALMTTAAEAEAGTGRSGPGGRGSAALVFGGCTPEGVFLNDAHVLDLRDWSWSPAEAPAGPPPPPPRYGASATAVGGRLLLYGGSDARQPFGGVVSVVTDFGSDLNAVAGDMLVSSHHSASSPAAAAAAATAQRRLSATAVPAGAETGADDDAPSSPSLSSAPLSPSFATPVAAPTPPPLPSSSSFSPPPPIATGGSMRSRLADALGRRSAQATAAAAARKAAVAEGLFRAERERADALAADLAAARLLLGEERASLEGEARRAALVVSASARREAESARRAAAAAAGAQREAELRAEEAERRAEEAEARAAEAEEREQRSVSAGEDREASLAASLRARLRAAEAGRASAAREAVAARAAADAARQGAARARAEAVAEATARQGSASLELLVREVSRLQAHARALEAALEGAGEAALAARASSGGAGAGVGAGAGGAAGAASPPPPSAAAVTALELQLSRYRGEPATLASLSPEELRSLEDELVKSARAAAEAAREADAASAAALRAALADREARLRSLARCPPSAAAGASAALARSSSSTAECGICLEREVEVSLDCGHLLCSGCAEEQRARKGRCPFCDAPVTGTRRVFVG